MPKPLKEQSTELGSEMARGLKNNNPGNIRLSREPWVGEIRPSKDRSFCQFETMPHGYRALLKLLQNYKNRHSCNTISKMINRWAPPVENNTEIYIRFVAKQTGIDRHAVIDVENKDEMLKLAAAISEMENGVKPVIKEIEQGWDLLCGVR